MADKSATCIEHELLVGVSFPSWEVLHLRDSTVCLSPQIRCGGWVVGRDDVLTAAKAIYMTRVATESLLTSSEINNTE
jgi:hypothetical protein